MAAQIRQEINLLDHSLTGAGASANEIAQLDTSQYNGTATYYFEIVAINTDVSNARSVFLTRSIGNIDATISVPANTTSYTLIRSSSFTPNSATLTYFVSLSAAQTTLTVKSARIVIIQNATTLTNTETQIEIGNYNTGRTTESAAILTNPKYWKYDASKWDGTKTFYAEAVYDSGDMDTISVYLYESAAIDAPSWSSVATIVNAGTTTVPTRTRVAFTPTDGRWYTIFSLNGSMDNHDIYRAGIVVQQVDGAYFATDDASVRNVRGGTGATLEQAYAQSFKIQTTATVTGVKLKLLKTGSPTDTLNIDIVSSLGGSSLANATQDASALTTSPVVYTYTFGSPVSLTGGNTYYIQLTRSPDTADATNNVIVHSDNAGATYPDGTSHIRNNGSWSAEADADLYFEIVGGGGILKLEPQYLLANTLFAAGTGLQTFLTDWDSTEWDDGAGSITYYFQAEAANGSTSDVTLEEADGGGTVTNSTLTNIDNAQISAAMTMPADQNLDTKATTNAGDVAAARILVTYVFAAAAEGTPSNPTDYQDFIITG